jgi:hypothetical protein
LITAVPVTVPVSGDDPASIQLGPWANQVVTISNQSGHTVYLGGGSGVTSTNGFPLPTGVAPLSLGRVTGTLWAQAATADSVIGVLVTSPE